MSIVKRIKNVQETHSITKKVIDVFYPQYRYVILWGFLPLRWHDYYYEFGDDILLGLGLSTHKFKDITEATEFLKNN